MRLLRLYLAEKALLRATGLETSLAIQIADECRNERGVLETRAHPAFLFLSSALHTFVSLSFNCNQFLHLINVSMPDPREYDRGRASCHWQCENNCIKNTHDVHILKKKTMRRVMQFRPGAHNHGRQTKAAAPLSQLRSHPINLTRVRIKLHSKVPASIQKLRWMENVKKYEVVTSLLHFMLGF
jgi:hypothetical protein